MTNNLDGQCTELVILTVGECLRRGNNDTLTGMNTERVEILHVTNRDTVVILVAHDLVFYLLPSLETLLNEHLGRERECLLGQLVEFLLIITESRTKSTECISCTQDDWITKFSSGTSCLFDIFTSLTLYGLHINLVELVHKEFAVFCIHDCLYGSSEHLHSILIEYAAAIEFHSTVEGCLTAECEQDTIGAFLLNDTLHEIGLDGEEVNLVGHTLRCLHSGNIGVDEHCLHTFLTQCLECL